MITLSNMTKPPPFYYHCFSMNLYYFLSKWTSKVFKRRTEPETDQLKIKNADLDVQPDRKFGQRESRATPKVKGRGSNWTVHEGSNKTVCESERSSNQKGRKLDNLLNFDSSFSRMT